MKPTGGVKIAEVWGIPIAVHPSWLVVFALFAWSLARGYFPIEYPGGDAVTYWVVGAVTALLAFGSVLVRGSTRRWRCSTCCPGFRSTADACSARSLRAGRPRPTWDATVATWSHKPLK